MSELKKHCYTRYVAMPDLANRLHKCKDGWYYTCYKFDYLRLFWQLLIVVISQNCRSGL